MSWIAEQDRTKVETMRARMVEKGWTTGARNWLEAARGNEDFAMWMALVDRRVSRAVGLGMFDLGDWTWADAFEDGASPAEAARDALEADDTFGAMFDGGE